MIKWLQKYLTCRIDKLGGCLEHSFLCQTQGLRMQGSESSHWEVLFPTKRLKKLMDTEQRQDSFPVRSSSLTSLPREEEVNALR